MSFTIPDWFVQQFIRGVHYNAQQMGSRLRSAVRMETGIVGKSAFVDRLGATQAQKRLARHQDSPLVSTPHSRRRLDLVDYEWGDMVDQQDKVRTLNDPQNPYTQNAGWAMGRALDTEIVAAFDGNAFSGAGGAGDTVTTVAFPAAQEVAVDFTDTGGSGNTGLTVDKLRQAKELLDNADVDESDTRHIAVRGKQLHNLLTSTPVTSADFNTVKALVRGEINSFVGFEFHRTQLLPVSAGDIASVFAWAQSGIVLGIGMDETARIAERPDKSFGIYAYYMMTIGATRVEEARVVRVLCDQSP